MVNAKVIGERLRSLRGKKKADEVSKAVGISNSALCMYERGERVPRDEVKVRLAQYYGQSIEAIFYTI